MARAGVTVLKVIHGWGSSGEGGKLGPAIRKSLADRPAEATAQQVLGHLAAYKEFGSSTSFHDA